MQSEYEILKVKRELAIVRHFSLFIVFEALVFIIFSVALGITENDYHESELLFDICLIIICLTLVWMIPRLQKYMGEITITASLAMTLLHSVYATSSGSFNPSELTIFCLFILSIGFKNHVITQGLIVFTILYNFILNFLEVTGNTGFQSQPVLVAFILLKITYLLVWVYHARHTELSKMQQFSGNYYQVKTF
mmetsp:Transcript_14892/g.23077  ORF Transcript_14892/g.23077 Transcript_14892/m.23077 type:complete len:193 (-) Transcript_14892:293-871(-)